MIYESKLLKTLIVDGNPKPLKRHRTGRNNHTYDPSKADKEEFLWSVSNKKPMNPYVIPLFVDMYFYMKRPKVHYGTGKNSDMLKKDAPHFHTNTPDLDNLTKFVLDALNKVFWKDDSCICYFTAVKQYDTNPRTIIEIHEGFL